MRQNEVKRIPCFAHTLQLVFEDGLKSTCVTRGLEKAYGIASATHQRADLENRINEQNLTVIPLRGTTRWNGELKCLESVLKIHDQLSDLLDSSLLLSTNEKRQLKEYVKILKPFEHATKKCEGDVVATINCVIPIVIGLNKHLEKQLIESNMCSDLVEKLHHSLNSRYCGILNFEFKSNNTQNEANFFADKVFLLAAMLDPFVKLFWLEDLSNQTEIEIQSIRDRCFKIMIEEMKVMDEYLGLNQETERKSKSINKDGKELDFSDEIFSNRIAALTQALSPITENKYEIELNEYLSFCPTELKNKDFHVADYWKMYGLKFPILLKVIKYVLAACATSEPSERVFSRAGLRMSPHRSRSSHETISR